MGLAEQSRVVARKGFAWRAVAVIAVCALLVAGAVGVTRLAPRDRSREVFAVAVGDEKVTVRRDEQQLCFSIEEGGSLSCRQAGSRALDATGQVTPGGTALVVGRAPGALVRDVRLVRDGVAVEPQLARIGGDLVFVARAAGAGQWTVQAYGANGKVWAQGKIAATRNGTHGVSVEP